MKKYVLFWEDKCFEFSSLTELNIEYNELGQIVYVSRKE